ncbi:MULTISPECIES: glycosyltransferase family 2 protein [Pseudomonas]|uniref:Glycosyltransferase family 2 protein n=1 Tax=Pseudomonas mosselii TaxID=78327 RepID=A0A5R8Z9L7_9PSED|nr:glycosyltransferase family 2 protein [Pseudomonas mosselii]TLP61727.1 glycosyltransferase family 2 protein [Pseudomonas mosselii]
MPSPEVLISLVVPAYNYAKLLPRALDSVLCQWADDLELIVVNDGSRDNTLEVLAGYVARYPQLQVIDQANAGAAAARNNAIAKARGRYVLLLDADDELTPGALEALREVLAANPQAGMVLGAQLSVYPDGRERLRLPTPVPRASALELARRYLLQKRISVSHCCTLFARELLLRRPYPQGLRTGEDIPVFAFLLVNAQVAVTNAPIARIHKHADSLRHSRENEEEYAMGMVREVFASLPAECQVLRRRYTAQRYLSLFRAALLADERALARRFYAQALRLSPLQAMRWTYLRKALRLMKV